MTTSTRQHLDLQTAADALGVHYQTAYRWVRSGRLQAHRIGGKYVVARDDLESFDRERSLRQSPTRPSTPRLDRSAEQMHRLLIAGDEPEARRLARRLVDEGAPAVDVVQRVLAPSLARIGQAWHDGDLSIWVEHRSASIVERILGEITPNPRGRRRGTAVVAAIAGDRHSLPTTMAAVALRDDHWHVHHLGADIPVEEILDFCALHPVDIVVLTSTNPATHDDSCTAADRVRSSGTPAIVGEPGRTLDELIEVARDTVVASPSGQR